MSQFEYHTINRAIESIVLKEKGSKFIGFAFPVLSEEEVKVQLQCVQDLHPKATHHCYAYRLGVNGENYRINDDGEPSGSAGLPIYNQLLAHDVTYVLLVVVRYYGGTKLGVGGLVKTYKESASLTLDAAQIVTKKLQINLTIEFDYPYQNQVFTLLNKWNAQIVDFESASRCKIEAKIDLSEKEKISEKLSEMHYLSYGFSN